MGPPRFGVVKADGTFELNGENIDVVFTHKVAQLSGELRDDRGNVPPDAWVVIFPADETKWLLRSRLIRVSRPDKAGAYRTALDSA